jgi:hypothetical protein
MTLESTHSLIEMSTRKLSEGKWWPALKTDNLTAMSEPTVNKRGILDVSQSYRPTRPIIL